MNRHASKTTGTWAVAIAIAFCFGLTASEAAASEKQLIGTWKMDRMVKGKQVRRPPAGQKASMQFKKDHTLVARGQRAGKVLEQTGSWKLTGDTLITTMKGKPSQVITVKFVGAYLEMTRKGSPVKLVMKRLK